MKTTFNLFQTVGNLAATVAVVGLLACCTPPSKRERMVTVTIPPQKSLAEAIAGDLYEVRCMVPKGSSPESYDPTPADLMQLGHSSAYFRIGHIGFELAWMERIEKNNRGMKVFDNSTGIELIAGEHECSDNSAHHHGHFDPHVWTSPRQLQIVARNMADAFCRLDPENAVTYRDNLARLSQLIGQCDSTVFQIVAGLTHRTFAIYHPSLGYLARDYGLRQISLENEGKEPSASHLAGLQKQMREQNVEVVFVQQEFDRKNAELLANENHCRLIQINPLNEDWYTEIIAICTALRNESERRDKI